MTDQVKHELEGGALVNEAGKGIIGRCSCGWTTGHRFSSFAASVAFRDHLDAVGATDERGQPTDGGDT